MNDVLIKGVIEYLTRKLELTELEKSILETSQVLLEEPFNIKKAKLKVIENNAKYPDLYPLITSMPTTITKPMAQADELDVRYNLSCQLELMCSRISMN